MRYRWICIRRTIPLLVLAASLAQSWICAQGVPDARSQLDIFMHLSEDVVMEFVWIADLDMWVGRHEVTLGQYVHMSKSAAKRPDDYSMRYADGIDVMTGPAVMIGWNDARSACHLLNRKHRDILPDGYVFRLPTETEWETMARCGDDRDYPWGNDWPPTPMADDVLPNLQGVEMIPPWEQYHSARSIEDHQDGWASLAPVASSGANEWRIYGLAGNVMEWCEGWYDKERKLRLLKGSSASTFNSRGSEIAKRTAVDGQSPVRGWFLWGEVRNQGNIAAGFRVMIGRPLDE